MKVKLEVGYSYSDGEISVNKNNPIVEVTEEKGQELIDSGHFVLIGEIGPELVVADEKEYIVEPVDFDKMTVNQLKKYAEENDIDISGLTKKAEIKQALLDGIKCRVPAIFTE